MSKWDNFEPYKGPEKKHLPPWLENIIVKAGITIGLLIIGCIGAFLPFIVATRYGTRRWLMEASDKELWIMAASGATASIVTVIIWYKNIKK